MTRQPAGPAPTVPTPNQTGAAATTRRAGPTRRRAFGPDLALRAEQVVAAQVALAVLVAGGYAGVGWLVLVTPAALALLVLALGRIRRRWVYQWAAALIDFLSRHRTLPQGSSPAALLGYLRPGATVSTTEIDGAPLGFLADGYGLTALLEIGDLTALLVERQPAIPPLGSLLPPGAAGQPAVRLQLLLAGRAATAGPRAGTVAANSYRQLTEGRVLARQRVLLAVHVRPADGLGPAHPADGRAVRGGPAGGVANAGLTRGLASATRRVRRRVEQAGLPCRPLSGTALLGTLADLADHDAAYPVRERWSTVRTGRSYQVVFRLGGRPARGGGPDWPEDLAARMLGQSLAVPAAGTTVSLSVERSGPGNVADAFGADLLIRLAAPSPDALASACGALVRFAAAHARVDQLDGAQLAGLAATLPLGAAGRGAATLGAATLGGATLGGATGPAGAARTGGLPPPSGLATIPVPVAGAGLVLGVNRHHEPVTLRLFRPEPTRVVLIGGLRCAQLVVLRALALGAHVVVQSDRPYDWEPFQRGTGGAECAMTLLPAGRIVEPAPAEPARPQLAVVDLGPAGTTGRPVAESPWRATLLVRDGLAQADLAALARADLAILQPLTPEEATTAAATLGLRDSAQWLPHIREDMVGLVVGRRGIRWALLSITPIERQLIGSPTRAR